MTAFWLPCTMVSEFVGASRSLVVLPRKLTDLIISVSVPPVIWLVCS